MIKLGYVNALNVFGLRLLEHNPPHFTKVPFDLRVNSKTVSDWIYQNLEGRFWFGDYYDVDSTGKIFCSKCVSFELAAEASMFALILNQINTPSETYF
jgi:hypothetical protein